MDKCDYKCTDIGIVGIVTIGIGCYQGSICQKKEEKAIKHAYWPQYATRWTLKACIRSLVPSFFARRTQAAGVASGTPTRRRSVEGEVPSSVSTGIAWCSF